MPPIVAGATVSPAITDATLFSGGVQARKPAKTDVRAHIGSVVNYFRISTVLFATEEHLGVLQLQQEQPGDFPTVQWVLPHRIPRRARRGDSYYLVGVSPWRSPASALGKPLLFGRCLPVAFPRERIGITLLFKGCFPIVFPSERYDSIGASPSHFSASALGKGQPV